MTAAQARDGAGGRRSAARAALVIGAAVALAAVLRAAFLAADPPYLSGVGITWHDEGGWAHNARNYALTGTWILDRWNPIFVSPVVTLLEALVFKALGVGLVQARLVSVVFGVLAVGALAWGLLTVSRRAAAAGACLLAVNFVFVMYTRVALLESPMIGLLVVSWAAYAVAGRRAWLAFASGLVAVLAFFAKASAVFFLVALGLEALLMIAAARWPRTAGLVDDHAARRGWFVLAGLAAGTLAGVIAFILPNWSEWSFYNLYVYGSRRAITGLDAIAVRASWLPIIHDFSTRTLGLGAVALAGVWSVVLDPLRRRPAERLLVLWLVLGCAELVFHDVGNERRLVFLLPAMAGVAACWLEGATIAAMRFSRRHVLLASPALLYGFYLLWGPLTRLPFLTEVRPAARLGGLMAVVSVAAVWAFWPRCARFLARGPSTAAPALVLLGVLVTGEAIQYAQWASARSYRNIEASRAVGRLLPAGTRVHGKLANGMALENGITPVFIGPGFGNYDDRLDRDDVRYLLTYERPRLGYEGRVILDVLAHCPQWRVVARFEVAETAGGRDSAVLVDKGRCLPPPR